jgi:hypothetical protein
MHERMTRKTVDFKHPFSLAGIGHMLAAGTYLIETHEEMIEGLSFVAFRRVSTTIEIPDKMYGRTSRQIVAIDPTNLEAAQKLDEIESLDRPQPR